MRFVVLFRLPCLSSHALRYQSSARPSWIQRYSAMASVAAAEPSGKARPSSQPRHYQGKRPSQYGGGPWQKRARKKQQKAVQEGSTEEVLAADIQALLKEVDDASPSSPLPEPGSEIEAEVTELSSTGDGLARQDGSSRIYVVPFTAPGDRVKVKVFRHLGEEQYSIADLVSIAKPSPLRDNSRIRCQYFSKCGGCQFQMLDYTDQLRFKKTVVEKAYRNFSQLPPELVPEVQDTIGSPLQYGYRTKLTPHFDGPRKRKHERRTLEQVPDVGFMEKGSRKTMDIEDCPIGTDAVRRGMTRERARVTADFAKFERGATILLRESTTRISKSKGQVDKVGADDAGATHGDLPPDAVRVETDSYTDFKTCITDNNATSTEYVDDFVFTNPAGFFFQNNNSILPVFTDYIRSHIITPASQSSPSAKPIRYLIDAYSGSGLFTITLSSLFPGGSVGIDIADKSITFARKNAALNALPESRCRFLAADAAALFKDVTYDPDETAVVVDPPRKGCDAAFLAQLLRFGPRRVAYVSCNVHTQARDVGVLVRGEVETGDGETVRGVRYEIESLRGFDFFPQTGHVEGVAFLSRVDEKDTSAGEP